MYALTLLSMALASSTLVHSAAIKTRVVAEDEVLAFGINGRYEVIKLADWEAELARTNITIGRPDSPLDHPEQFAAEINETESAGALEKRCKNDKIISRNKDQDFLDWDIALSSVIEATGPINNIAATAGVTIGNSITTTRSVDITFIKDYISATVSQSFERSWTSSLTTQYTLSVPTGQRWGIMVSNPRTYRRSGYVKTGCVGSQTSAYFQADEHFPKSHQGLNWVEGIIRICSSKTYPIKACIGNGVHR